MSFLWIDGARVASRGGRPRRIDDPATLEPVGEVVDATADDVTRAVASASAAHSHWRRTPAVERAKFLHETARLLREDRAMLSALLTREGGKPRIENLDEVEWCAACFDYYAEIARNSHGSSVPPVAEHQLNFTIKEPLGVVGCIAPFNYPLLLMTWKVAPAVAAGNSVVMKPSELTPLATLRMAEHTMAHFPPGVANVVTGTGPEAGEPLVDHPDVACIAFTGSTIVGTRIATRAASRLARVNLELGGIDPCIVFEDADLDVAVPGVAWARFLNAGQVCTSAKRIYIVQTIADRFVERFVAHVRTIRLGHGMDPTVDMGPLISSKALARVDDQVARAKAQGATIVAGGSTREDAGPGYFYAPTLLTDVRRDHAVVCEEVFGPIASIQVVKDADEAIDQAAASEYGLGANIYTSNLTWAMRAMSEIKAGTFWINDPLTDNDAAPFGGMRKSGMGRELGEEGLDAFRETKHVHMDFVPERKAYWYPYSRRASEIPD
ncbi:MAG TPA: aldehyde dehydrogenase family protein [Vicinamibacterales bacterium]|nr:aldehyde dehydrogenase family protein [Vicinamibacterales bacterium]